MTKAEWNHMYQLVGAAMEVFNQLGHGLQEPIYQESLALELLARDITFEREAQLSTYYKGHLLSKKYYADFYSEGIIIELKSVEKLTADHRAQLFNYIRITNNKLGILINYGEPALRCERYWLNPETNKFILLTRNNYMQYIDPPDI